MDLGLRGRLALVTGSTAGIGYAIAQGLLAEGARVVVNGRTPARVAAAIEGLNASGRVFGVAADMATVEGAATVVAAVNAIGKLDVLVNNVGYFEVKPLAELEDTDWDAMFQLNVMSAVRMSKAAMVSVARGLAEATKGSGVTVNSALVGATWSDGVDVFMQKMAQAQGLSVEQMTADYFKTEAGNSLLQRFATPKEIADQIVFLCSANASAVNGAAQRVDGGIIRAML